MPLFRALCVFAVFLHHVSASTPLFLRSVLRVIFLPVSASCLAVMAERDTADCQTQLAITLSSHTHEQSITRRSAPALMDAEFLPVWPEYH